MCLLFEPIASKCETVWLLLKMYFDGNLFRRLHLSKDLKMQDVVSIISSVGKIIPEKAQMRVRVSLNDFAWLVQKSSYPWNVYRSSLSD